MSEKISIKQNAVLVNATSGVRGEGLPSGHQRAMYLLATARPNGETFQKARTESLASWLKGIADTANKMEQDVSIEISRSQNGTPTHVGNIPVSALAVIANPASKPEAVASAQAQLVKVTWPERGRSAATLPNVDDVLTQLMG